MLVTSNTMSSPSGALSSHSILKLPGIRDELKYGEEIACDVFVTCTVSVRFLDTSGSEKKMRDREFQNFDDFS